MYIELKLGGSGDMLPRRITIYTLKVLLVASLLAMTVLIKITGHSFTQTLNNSCTHGSIACVLVLVDG